MQRHMRITYDDKNEFFKICSDDRQPVLSDHTENVIKDKGWFVAYDGHIGTNVIVCAPKDKHNFLNNLLNNNRTNKM